MKKRKALIGIAVLAVLGLGGVMYVGQNLTLRVRSKASDFAIVEFGGKSHTIDGKVGLFVKGHSVTFLPAGKIGSVLVDGRAIGNEKVLL